MTASAARIRQVLAREQELIGLSIYVDRSEPSVKGTLEIALRPLRLAKSGKPIRSLSNRATSFARSLVGLWLSRFDNETGQI